MSEEPDDFRCIESDLFAPYGLGEVFIGPDQNALMGPNTFLLCLLHHRSDFLFSQNLRISDDREAKKYQKAELFHDVWLLK